IAGDDTHGHVDDLARFVDARTVVVASEEDPTDPNYDPLRENRERLARMTDQDAAPLRVVELPMPAPVVFDGERLPASYANFYVANAAVLVPTFNDPRDRQALETLAELFPGRRVVGIHAVALVLGLGTLLAHLPARRVASQHLRDLEIDEMRGVQRLPRGRDPPCNHDARRGAQQELEERGCVEHDHRRSRSARTAAAGRGRGATGVRRASRSSSSARVGRSTERRSPAST